MDGRNLYGISLAAIWHGLWGTILILLGILITFNVQDTYFESGGAPSQFTTEAVIVGLTTLLYGVAVVGVGLGLWFVKGWAWWAAVTVGAIVLVADIVNFARLANELSLLNLDEFPRQVAAWPILMWTEQMTFLGSKQAQVLVVGWPLLFHIIVSIPVILYLLAPPVRELFITAPAPAARPSALEATRVRVAEPLPEPADSSAQQETVAGQEEKAALGYLIIQNGPRAGESYALKKSTTIGRSRRSNDIVVDDSAASRDHAVVRLEDGKFVYQDRGSRNRSYLVSPTGPKEIQGRHTLLDGDEILAGETRLLFRDGRARQG